MSTAGTTVVRKGSAEKAIPHTRIQDDQMIKDNYEVSRHLLLVLFTLRHSWSCTYYALYIYSHTV